MKGRAVVLVLIIRPLNPLDATYVLRVCHPVGVRARTQFVFWFVASFQLFYLARPFIRLHEVIDSVGECCRIVVLH